MSSNIVIVATGEKEDPYEIIILDSKNKFPVNGDLLENVLSWGSKYVERALQALNKAGIAKISYNEKGDLLIMNTENIFTVNKRHGTVMHFPCFSGDGNV